MRDMDANLLHEFETIAAHDLERERLARREMHRKLITLVIGCFLMYAVGIVGFELVLRSADAEIHDELHQLEERVRMIEQHMDELDNEN